jgi:hypothetical protein
MNNRFNSNSKSRSSACKAVKRTSAAAVLSALAALPIAAPIVHAQFQSAKDARDSNQNSPIAPASGSRANPQQPIIPQSPIARAETRTAWRNLLELARQLEDPNPENRKQAAARLAELGSGAKAARWALIKRTDDADPAVRAYASHALWAVDGRPELPVKVLIGLLESPDAGPSELACYFLGAMGRDASPATAKLRELLAGSSPRTRLLAAEAIVKIGPSDAAAIESMTRHVGDSDPEIRALSASLLAEHGRNQKSLVTPALTAALKDTNEQVRATAERSIKRFGWNIAIPPEASRTTPAVASAEPQPVPSESAQTGATPAAPAAPTPFPDAFADVSFPPQPSRAQAGASSPVDFAAAPALVASADPFAEEARPHPQSADQPAPVAEPASPDPRVPEESPRVYSGERFQRQRSGNQSKAASPARSPVEPAPKTTPDAAADNHRPRQPSDQPATAPPAASADAPAAGKDAPQPAADNPATEPAATPQSNAKPPEAAPEPKASGSADSAAPADMLDDHRPLLERGIAFASRLQQESQLAFSQGLMGLGDYADHLAAALSVQSTIAKLENDSQAAASVLEKHLQMLAIAETELETFAQPNAIGWKADLAYARMLVSKARAALARQSGDQAAFQAASKSGLALANEHFQLRSDDYQAGYASLRQLAQAAAHLSSDPSPNQSGRLASAHLAEYRERLKKIIESSESLGRRENNLVREDDLLLAHFELARTGAILAKTAGNDRQVRAEVEAAASLAGRIFDTRREYYKMGTASLSDLSTSWWQRESLHDSAASLGVEIPKASKQSHEAKLQQLVSIASEMRDLRGRNSADVLLVCNLEHLAHLHQIRPARSTTDRPATGN